MMDQHTFSFQSGKSSVSWDLIDIWKSVESLPIIEKPVSLYIHLSKQASKIIMIAILKELKFLI